MTHGTTAEGKENLATVILALLFAVTLESVLSQVFGDWSHYDTFSELWQFLRRLFIAPNREANALIGAQVIVFLLTLVRFYLGALRYCRETAGKVKYEGAVGTSGTLLLFAGLYITGLSVKTTHLFYVFVIVFHFLDWAWFYLATFCLPSSGFDELKTIVHVWQGLDIITVLLIGALLSFGASPWAPLLVLFVVGAADFFLFHRFYAAKPDWKTSSWGLHRLNRLLGRQS